MYVRQNSVTNRLGIFEGELGQIPTQTITIADPVDGAQLTFSGPINEIANIQAIIGMVSGAVSEAKKNGNFANAKAVLSNAKKVLAATGSQRDKASFLINKAEKFVLEKEAAQGPTAGEILTGAGAIAQALAPAGLTAVQAYQESRLAKAALKNRQPSVFPMMMPAAAPSSNTGVILAVVGGVVVVGLILMMQKKK